MDLAWSFVNVLTLGIVWGFDRRMTWQIASVSARVKFSLARQRTKLVPGILIWKISFGVLYAQLSAVLVSWTTDWQATA